MTVRQGLFPLRQAFFFVLALAALIPGGPLFPQASAGTRPEEGRDTPYMIPRKVYVGDQARLVVPLSAAHALAAAAHGTAKVEANAPVNDELVILGLEVESRGETARLNIDFAAYKTGWVEFPPVAIGPQKITGLGAEISSILEAGEEGRLLSPAAQALPVPGTVMMVYGLVIASLVCIIVLTLLTVWLVKSRDALGRRFRRKRALGLMRKNIRRLKDELEKKDFSPPLGGELLGRLSLALRHFLSGALDRNCLSLVPGEFRSLDFERSGDGLYVEERLDFLASFFSRSDTLRFGFGIDRSGVASMVEETLDFINAFEKYRPPLPPEEQDTEKTVPGEIPGAERNGGRP
jgi:hypothetical protein